MRSLRPLKREKGSIKPFVVADVEAATWTRFLVVGLYDGQECHYFYDLSVFLRHLIKRYPDHDCYAHFGGGYDFLFFLQGKIECPKIKINSMIPRGSSILSMEFEYEGKTVTFRDSAALLPFRLADLTKNFGVTHIKQSIDYEAIRKVTPELLTYLEYDLKGLFEVIEKFRSNKLIQRSGSAHTIASQSLRVFRCYQKKTIYGLNTDQDQFARRSYLGGRTEIFKPLHRSGPLYEYDVNSLYPHVMRENEYPISFYGETYREVPGSMAIYKARVVVPEMRIPPLGILKNGKFIFPIGHFCGYWTSAELKYAKSLGCKYEVEIGHLYTNGGRIFRDYIDELYRIRLESPKNSVDNILAKLMMNSLYGRFGLDLEKEIFEFDEGQGGVYEGPEIQAGKNFYRLMRKPIKLNTFNNVAISSFVTGYARIHMHKLMNKFPDSIYYTDTDSIFTTHEYPHNEKLGSLKLEKIHEQACFLLPKTYRTNSKIAMKGFDKKKIQHLEYQDFVNALEGTLRLEVKHDAKFAKLKSALKQKNFLTMVPAHTRRIMSRYDKREIFESNGSYDSKPIELKE